MLRRSDGAEDGEVWRKARDPALSNALEHELGLNGVLHVLLVDGENLESEGECCFERLDITRRLLFLKRSHSRIFEGLTRDFGERHAFAVQISNVSVAKLEVFAEVKNESLGVVLDLRERLNGSEDLRTPLGRLLRGRSLHDG